MHRKPSSAVTPSGGLGGGRDRHGSNAVTAASAAAAARCAYVLPASLGVLIATCTLTWAVFSSLEPCPPDGLGAPEEPGPGPLAALRRSLLYRTGNVLHKRQDAR
jgi:hypothetical protein